MNKEEAISEIVIAETYNTVKVNAINTLTEFNAEHLKLLKIYIHPESINLEFTLDKIFNVVIQVGYTQNKYTVQYEDTSKLKDTPRYTQSIMIYLKGMTNK